ncbi:hypothetical protein DSCO28_22780 [Desulfosarcina ovata subsp. sediminis]|uniref:Uncharacterized protein n=1 Tax=Desulfosarcina ovata subsp. sediminis TaxID=885957 RepID=A0A5K7ZHX3_9BACT|nr:hypothetical protein DSCO28_22780 [Desulfosarcina ovata subsp. sediminis]
MGDAATPGSPIFAQATIYFKPGGLSRGQNRAPRVSGSADHADFFTLPCAKNATGDFPLNPEMKNFL